MPGRCEKFNVAINLVLEASTIHRTDFLYLSSAWLAWQTPFASSTDDMGVCVVISPGREPMINYAELIRNHTSTLHLVRFPHITFSDWISVLRHKVFELRRIYGLRGQWMRSFMKWALNMLSFCLLWAFMESLFFSNLL